MNGIFHSVTLREDKCKGCINCMKRCPTEAIRVREGKATIIKERCIDCGECIRVCTNLAKQAVSDGFEVLDRFEWKVAMPAPSFYGQFDNIDDINIILTGLKRIGFDDVFGVARAAEIVSDLTRKNLAAMRSKVSGPIISSACSAVVRLIRVRFPELCANVLPVNEPLHLASRMAKEEAMAKTGLPADKIGVFFISPCPAKVTSSKSPIGIQQSHVDGVLSVSTIYFKMLSALKTVDTPENLLQSGIVGINWGVSGGESAALLTDKYLTADGIENVIKVLEAIEDDKLDDLDFVELNACPGGCVGGVLNIANAFVARSRLKTLRKYLPVMKNKSEGDDSRMFWEAALEYETIDKLDDDLIEAMNKMKKIDQMAKQLPGLDCGSCGAPSCRAFAEDVVRGDASENDCIIRFREQLSMLSGLGIDLESIIPAPFRQHGKGESEGET